MKRLKLILTTLLIASLSAFACGGEDPGVAPLEPEPELEISTEVSGEALRASDGATCMVDCSTGAHSECGTRWYMVRHALPNVTQHCTDTATLWCNNRGWWLYNAWWSHSPENRAWCY